MGFNNMLRPLMITGTGMTAERMRMEVVANNIANASSTRTPEGGPFRRHEVVFQSVLDNVDNGPYRGKALGGVKALGIVEDTSEFPQVYNPGHPDANAEGMVTMPNVHLPIEMVNLITATRSYEANVRAAQTFVQMSETALSISRG